MGLKSWAPVFEALSDSDEQVRRTVVTVIEREKLHGFPLPDIEAPLLHALASTDTRVLMLVTRHLTFTHYTSAAPALAAIYENPRQDEAVRTSAAFALSELGDVANLDTFVHMLRSPDPRVREHAASKLTKIGPPAAAAIPTLSQILNDPAPRVSPRLAEALGAVAECATGEAADTAAAALVAQLRIESHRLQPALDDSMSPEGAAAKRYLLGTMIPGEMRMALMRIGPAAISPMIAAAGDDSVAMRAHVAAGLGAFTVCPKGGSSTFQEVRLHLLYHQYARATVPTLLALMRDETVTVRAAAVESLRRTLRHINDMPDVIALVTRARNDQNPYVRESVEKTLSDPLPLIAFSSTLDDQRSTSWPVPPTRNQR
jgi:HEAT repeat protein